MVAGSGFQLPVGSSRGLFGRGQLRLVPVDADRVRVDPHAQRLRVRPARLQTQRQEHERRRDRRACEQAGGRDVARLAHVSDVAFERRKLARELADRGDVASGARSVGGGGGEQALQPRDDALQQREPLGGGVELAAG